MAHLIENKKIRYSVIGLVAALVVAFIAYEAVYSYRLDNPKTDEKTVTSDTTKVSTDTTAVDTATAVVDTTKADGCTL